MRRRGARNFSLYPFDRLLVIACIDLWSNQNLRTLEKETDGSNDFLHLVHINSHAFLVWKSELLLSFIIQVKLAAVDLYFGLTRAKFR